MRRIYCISEALPTLPINIEDAARSEKEIEEASLVCDCFFGCIFYFCSKLE